jgi:hypothetical protein
MGHPRAVEIAAATSTAATTAIFSRSPARLFGFGFAASRRLFSLDRSRRLPRTGHGFFVVADAAAGTAGLRQRGGGTDHDGEGAKKGNLDLTSNGVWHQYHFQ